MNRRALAPPIVPDRLSCSLARALEEKWDLTPHAALHAAVVMAGVGGLTITSGRRSLERNRAVGGVSGSFHLSGRAVDFSGPAVRLYAAAGYARATRVSASCTGPEEVLVHSVAKGGGLHLHCAW